MKKDANVHLIIFRDGKIFIDKEGGKSAFPGGNYAFTKKHIWYNEIISKYGMKVFGRNDGDGFVTLKNDITTHFIICDWVEGENSDDNCSWVEFEDLGSMVWDKDVEEIVELLYEDWNLRWGIDPRELKHESP